MVIGGPQHAAIYRILGCRGFVRHLVIGPAKPSLTGTEGLSRPGRSARLWGSALRMTSRIARTLGRIQEGVTRTVADLLDPEFLKILVCPETKAPLIQIGEWLYSTDSGNRKRYPIRDGIPVLLIDQSEAVDEQEFQRLKTGTQES